MARHRFSPFWVDFALVSRLYNPEDELPTVFMTDIDLGNSSAARALRDAGIGLVPIQDFSGPGSRAHRLTTEAPRLFQRFHEIMVPAHICAGNDSLFLPECIRISNYRISMLARFCWQADLANNQSAEYVMTRDADVLLTDNIMATLGKHLQQGTDVLTFFEWSSQIVIWKREALNAFCDAQIEMLDMERQALWYVFNAGFSGMLTPIKSNQTRDDITDSWNDMAALQSFLRVMRPDLRTVVLCGSPADVENELCRNVALKAAAMASMLPVRAWNDTCCHVGDDAPVANPLWDFTCQHLEEFIEFRPGNKTSGRLPEVWSKFGWFDKPTAAEQSAFRVKERKYGPPERLPMVHFQSDCKFKGEALVQQHYIQPGFIPRVQF